MIFFIRVPLPFKNSGLLAVIHKGGVHVFVIFKSPHYDSNTTYGKIFLKIQFELNLDNIFTHSEIRLNHL